MPVRGGTLREVIINGVRYDATNESDPEFKLTEKSFENEITAGRNIHSVSRQVLAGFSDLELSVSDSDYARLAAIWNAGIEVSVIITRATGVSYGGNLLPEGELNLANGGKVSISMVGGSFVQL